jgi:hypothetical protein
MERNELRMGTTSFHKGVRTHRLDQAPIFWMRFTVDNQLTCCFGAVVENVKAFGGRAQEAVLGDRRDD